MFSLLGLIVNILISLFKSKNRLEAENAVLCHQVTVLRRQVAGRVHLTNLDRLFLVQLYRWFPSILRALAIVQPETLVLWHRAGFRSYWRWKSRPRGGRPQIEAELRALIWQMSIRFGELHASTVNCSSSGLKSRSRASPGTWSSDADHPVWDGAPFCGTMRQTSPPWICLSSRP